jgi:hypothetical protein
MEGPGPCWWPYAPGRTPAVYVARLCLCSLERWRGRLSPVPLRCPGCACLVALWGRLASELEAVSLLSASSPIIYPVMQSFKWKVLSNQKYGNRVVAYRLRL